MKTDPVTTLGNRSRKKGEKKGGGKVMGGGGGRDWKRSRIHLEIRLRKTFENRFSKTKYLEVDLLKQNFGNRSGITPGDFPQEIR